MTLYKEIKKTLHDFAHRKPEESEIDLWTRINWLIKKEQVKRKTVDFCRNCIHLDLYKKIGTNKKRKIDGCK